MSLLLPSPLKRPLFLCAVPLPLTRLRTPSTRARKTWGSHMLNRPARDVTQTSSARRPHEWSHTDQGSSSQFWEKKCPKQMGSGQISPFLLPWWSYCFWWFCFYGTDFLLRACGLPLDTGIRSFLVPTRALLCIEMTLALSPKWPHPQWS